MPSQISADLSQLNQLPQPCTPWSSPVCFITLCSPSSNCHIPTSTSLPSFNHASFISFMIVSSFILSSILETSLSQPSFVYLLLWVCWFLFLYIYSPVVDTTQAIYLPVSLSLSCPPRLLIISFIVEALLSSLVVVVLTIV